MFQLVLYNTYCQNLMQKLNIKLDFGLIKSAIELGLLSNES